MIRFDSRVRVCCMCFCICFCLYVFVVYRTVPPRGDGMEWSTIQYNGHTLHIHHVGEMQYKYQESSRAGQDRLHVQVHIHIFLIVDRQTLAWPLNTTHISYIHYCGCNYAMIWSHLIWSMVCAEQLCVLTVSMASYGMVSYVVWCWVGILYGWFDMIWYDTYAWA